MRGEGRWTPTRAKAQDTRASPYTAYSLETHPVEGSALDDGDLTTYVLVPGHQLHQPCHVLGQHLVDGLEQLRFDGVERGEVVVLELFLHPTQVREVARRDLMLVLDLGKNVAEVVNELALPVFLAEDGGHLLLQTADDVGMHLCNDATSSW